MTYIELFDKSVIENLCTTLAKQPERLVLVGATSALDVHAERYKKLFNARGYHTEIIPLRLDRNNLEKAVEGLGALVEQYDDCVFDLTGGNDLYLVAVGILHERCQDRPFQMHRVNIANGKVTDCDFDGNTVFENDTGDITVSIDELINACGGDIVYSDVKPDGTYRWDMTQDFKDDIACMWSICRRNPGYWNKQINVFEEAEQRGTADAATLTTVCEIEALRDALGPHYIFSSRMTPRLQRSGLLKQCAERDGQLLITYKNEQVKRCLTKAGQVLEMIVYLEACNAEYSDVMNGVSIDWDGVIHPDSFETENEIDIIAVHGMVPVFISCKNGQFDSNELYKLKSVADKFGGKHCKRVIIATSLGHHEADELLRERCKDMNIRLVEHIQEMDNSKFRRVIKNLWKS